MKVYLSEHIAPSAYERLVKQFKIVTDFDHPEELDGIIVRRAKVTRAIIERAKKLKIISMHGVGLDTIDTEAAGEYGIKVTNVPGQSAQSVAELAVTFMLALSRKLKFASIGLCEGRFQQFGLPELVGCEIYSKKLGLVGGGKIAGKVAAIMKNAFQAEIYCYDPGKSEFELKEMGYQKIDTIQELFRLADYVSISVPLTESTRNLINKSTFENANPNLILVNTARGGIVDEDALYEALVRGKIRAAASDVFLKEPPAANEPLLHLDNFIGTLHIGGSTDEALERVSNCAVDNLIFGMEETETKKRGSCCIKI